jgi:hypothetical protein
MWLLSAGFSVMQVIVALLSLVGALMLMSGCEFTVTGRRQLQTTIQAIDLATLTSPYAGTTVGQPDAYTPSCSSSYASDMVFFYDLPAGSTIEIGQTSNSFDSVHELSWGGTAPGTNIVTCTDDPDTSRSTWTNTESSTQRVFFVVGAYSSSGSGTFIISWSPPSGQTVAAGVSCRSTNTCGAGQGDCNYDSDCLGSLVCGSSNCGGSYTCGTYGTSYCGYYDDCCEASSSYSSYSYYSPPSPYMLKDETYTTTGLIALILTVVALIYGIYMIVAGCKPVS